MTSENYHCPRCGARFGIAGTATDDDDEFADEFYDAEVERHESGACSPAPAPEATRFSITVHVGDDVQVRDLSDEHDPLVSIRLAGYDMSLLVDTPARAERLAQALLDAANLLRPPADPPVSAQRLDAVVAGHTAPVVARLLPTEVPGGAA